jgi:hypothetical protein
MCRENFYLKPPIVFPSIRITNCVAFKLDAWKDDELIVNIKAITSKLFTNAVLSSLVKHAGADQKVKFFATQLVLWEKFEKNKAVISLCKKLIFFPIRRHLKKKISWFLSSVLTAAILKKKGRMRWGRACADAEPVPGGGGAHPVSAH